MAALTPAQQSFLEKFVAKPQPVTDAPAAESKTYGRLLTQAEDLKSRLESLSPKGKALMAEGTRMVKEALEAARKAAGEGDKVGAEKALTRMRPEMRTLSTSIPLVQTYVDEAKKFQMRLQQAQARVGGQGGIAITDYINRLKEDDQRRQAAEGRGDIRMALVACEARDHLHDAKMQDADRGAEFVALTNEIKAEFTRLEHLAPGGGDAKDVIAEVRDMMDSAEGFAQGGNWVGAVMVMRNARTELRVGTSGLELAQKLSGAGKGEDFDTAYRGFLTLFKGLSKTKGIASFAAELRQANALADEARAAMPDVARARELLEQALRACNDLVRPLVLQAQYQAKMKDVMAQRQAMAGLNEDGCIDAELRAAAAAIKSAADHAKSKAFKPALSDLDAAETHLRDANAAGQIYAELVRDGRKSIALKLQRLATEDDDAETKELRTLFDQISAAFEARNLNRIAPLFEQIERLIVV